MDKLAEFLKKSGMRKVGAGLYMFSAVCALLYVKSLPPEQFVSCVTMFTLGVFGGNAVEHFAKKDQPGA